MSKKVPSLVLSESASYQIYSFVPGDIVNLRFSVRKVTRVVVIEYDLPPYLPGITVNSLDHD